MEGGVPGGPWYVNNVWRPQFARVLGPQFFADWRRPRKHVFALPSPANELELPG